jgi:hypothetical protein
MRAFYQLVGLVLLPSAVVAQTLDAVPLEPGAARPIQGNVVVDVPATSTDTTGRVVKFEPERRVLTLDNGETYVLATTTPGTETLTPGLLVSLTYRIDGAIKIVQDVRTISAVPEADAPAFKPPVN